MQNAMLVSLSRQIALRRELDVIANNVANMTTTGFKREAMLYKEQQGHLARVNTFPNSDRPVSFVSDLATLSDITEGSIDQTNNPTDIAIKGDDQVFFTIQTPQGERYSRNGSFGIAANGTLVTNEGYPVLSDGGPITFTQQDKQIAVARDGTISSSEGIKGRLRLIRFENPHGMKKEGLSLFVGNGTSAPADTKKVSVIQGALERSNVKPVLELTRLMEVTRAYESMAQMTQKTDELRRSAIERLGRATA